MGGFRGIAWLVALLAASALIAACGDGTSTKEKNAYVREVNSAQVKFAATVMNAAKAITPSSSAGDDRRALRDFRRAIASVVSDLRAIDVPPEVRAEHDRLVAAMTGFGNDVQQANAALASPSRSTLERAQRRIIAATATVNTSINGAIDAINAKLRK